MRWRVLISLKIIRSKMQFKEVLTLERPPKIAKKESVAVMFMNGNEEGVIQPHDDTLLMTLTKANYAIHLILINNGSSAHTSYTGLLPGR